ncbi:MAG: MarC family protein [Bacteriovoracaceae bacterium]|nr:MarC family protein [Bacteriovoracaceae bacterium]
MLKILSFTALTFMTFLPMVDPFGNMPIFTSLTEGMPRTAAHRVAYKSCLFAFVAILVFAFFGNSILELFDISVDGLKIVGGVIFFIMGHEMLQAKLSRTKISETTESLTKEAKQHLDDIAITPLAIPLLCGPGAITNAIILMSQTGESVSLKVGFVLGTIGILLFTLFCFISATRIVKIIGTTLNKVFLRLMGLLLMVIAVEFFFSGLKPILRHILKIPS